MPRDFKKENEWSKQVYQVFRFKARKDTDEVENLKKAMQGKSFPDWVREHINNDIKNL